MTIALTGGGSGGHITPLLAVAAELKRQRPDSRIIYIGQRGDTFGDIPAANNHIDESYAVRAGKFRRYHGEGWRQLLDLRTLFLNARDAVYVLIGLFQSRKLLKRLKPDVLFAKGGFVGVPVGLAAAQLKIPYVTHDSDSIPGLANRIIARWAAVHAVAMPAEVYTYPKAKTVTTGIPLQPQFQVVTAALKRDYRGKIGIPDDAKLLFVIGGGLGSQRINAAVSDIVPHLLQQYDDLQVVHFAGKANETALQQLYTAKVSPAEQGRLHIFGYRNDMYLYSGAADLIIARAGATNLAEFALQAKACIVIPSPFLTGGHQLKNARYLAEKEAAAVIDEHELKADPHRLAKQIDQLIQNDAQRQRLADNLYTFARPDASKAVAELLLQTAEAQL